MCVPSQDGEARFNLLSSKATEIVSSAASSTVSGVKKKKHTVKGAA